MCVRNKNRRDLRAYKANISSSTKKKSIGRFERGGIEGLNKNKETHILKTKKKKQKQKN
jgi:hypothetical protein